MLLPIPTTTRTSRVTRPKTLGSRIREFFHGYVRSFPSFVGLYFFTTTTIALITHKLLIIQVHGPFSVSQLLFLGPFTFSFDLLTLYFLYKAFRSRSPVWRSMAGIVSLAITICSSTFVSMYLIANAEISWGRSIAVLSRLFTNVGHCELEFLW